MFVHFKITSNGKIRGNLVMYLKFIFDSCCGSYIQKILKCPSLYCNLQKAFLFLKALIFIKQPVPSCKVFFQCLKNKRVCLLFQFMWRSNLISRKGKYSEVKCLLSDLTFSEMTLAVQGFPK